MKIPDSIPEDDPRYSARSFAAALMRVVDEFRGEDWNLSNAEAVGLLEIVKADVVADVVAEMNNEEEEDG